MSFEARNQYADRLLVRAGYGLEIALLSGAGCLALAALRPDRPDAGLFLLAGLLLLAVSAAAMLSLRGTGLAGELIRRAARGPGAAAAD
jgi:hypothetical protein